ncbi:MAG: Gfo/Idh/MocA family protein [Anaerolineae bacterium]
MDTRVAIFGTGYWAQFQVAAWQALGVPVVAVWNRTRERAETFAARFGIPRVFDSPEALFEWGQFDLADIIASVEAHEPLVLMAARYGKPVICQKPMSDTLDSCRRMVQACEEAGVWYAVHENFRYQPPIEAVKRALDSGVCGRLERAHILMRSPDRAIMRSQPALLTMDHMALRDMGPHILDVARFLFGEIAALTTLPLIAYSDLPLMTGALTLLRTEEGLPVQCDLTHQWPYRIFVTGDQGSLLLDSEFRLHATTADGETVTDTRTWTYLPYIQEDEWQLHGGHAFVAVPACLAHLLDAFRRGVPAATSGAASYRTMQALFAAIVSSDEGRTVAPAELG